MGKDRVFTNWDDTHSLLWGHQPIELAHQVHKSPLFSADTLAEFCAERPLPAMWREFDALARVPVLLIRGANSDVLSAATVSAMRVGSTESTSRSRTTRDSSRTTLRRS